MPWALLLKYSLWINTLAIFILILYIELSVKGKHVVHFDELKYSIDCLFLQQKEKLFPGRNLHFINVRYSADDVKKFFLVESLERKWIIMDRELKAYGDYIFDKIIDEKDGVFSMRSGSDVYYVYLNSDKPRVNMRVI